MAINPSNKYFKRVVKSGYIDKTGAISYLNPFVDTENCFFCIARPRRFGKSVALKTLMAYYSKGCDSKDLFANYEISRDPSFKEHLNNHNVIYWDMNHFVSSVEKEGEFFNEFNHTALLELQVSFGEILKSYSYKNVIQALDIIRTQTDESFIFLIDEWDAPLRELSSDTEKKSYIDFFKNCLNQT